MPGIESRAPERTETSSGFFRSPNFLPVCCSSEAIAALHLLAQRRRIRPLVGVVVGADLGGDREPGRHRQPDAAHLGEVRALAAEQRLHRSVAVRLAAEEVDVLSRRSGFLRRLLRLVFASQLPGFAAVFFAWSFVQLLRHSTAYSV